MAEDTRHRQDPGSRRGGRVPKDLDPTPQFPDLDVIHEMLKRPDGTISVREAYEMKLALRVLDDLKASLEPIDDSSGQPCKECQRRVQPSKPASQVICGECAFWHDKLETAKATHPHAWMFSIRANGCHYTVNNDAHGPEMTVRAHNGQQIVTTRLRTQGPIPDRYRDGLPDNAIIIAGNPQRRPVGIVG